MEILENAQSVIVVPGYGMAVAQAQHTVQEMAEQLAARGDQGPLRDSSGGRAHAGAL